MGHGNEVVRIDEEELLRPLIGEQLSAVVFVQDYVQLQFDGPYLTAITLPVVTVGINRFSQTTPGYRDALCERIAHTVRSAIVSKGFEIQVKFDDESSISISLRPEDYRAAHAAIFQKDTEHWSAW